LHWANTFDVEASVKFRLRMEMAESWSLTHKKEYRMQSSMRCIGNGTIWQRRPQFVKAL
jgi:hypothetical protein